MRPSKPSMKEICGESSMAEIGGRRLGENRRWSQNGAMQGVRASFDRLLGTSASRLGRKHDNGSVGPKKTR